MAPKPPGFRGKVGYLRRGLLRGFFAVRAPLLGRAAPRLGVRVSMQNCATPGLCLQSNFHLKIGDTFCLLDTSGCGYGLQGGKRSLFKSHETKPSLFPRAYPLVISELLGFKHVCFLWLSIQAAGPFIQMHETSPFLKKKYFAEPKGGVEHFRKKIHDARRAGPSFGCTLNPQ